jgi:hypothetical protein
MFEVVAHDGANLELSEVLLPFAAWSWVSRGVSGAAEIRLNNIDSRNMAITVAAIVRNTSIQLKSC